MYKTFYGLEFNPFDKSLDTKYHFKSNDFNQAISRLEYIKNIKGIGLFTGVSGLGKTYALRHFVSTLSPSLFKVVYINISTLTVIEFYRALCLGLGIEPSSKKITMFRQIQETLMYLSKEKKVTPVIIVDEAQYLKTDILNDIKMLLNFDMDSKNYVTLILAGQPILNNILTKNIHEPLRQRITINYCFSGITKDEVDDYITSRLAKVNVHHEIFSKGAIEAIYGCSNGSIRKLNNLLENCLIIGSQFKKSIIDTEIVMNAHNEVEII